MSHTIKISKEYHNLLSNVTENIINTITDSSNKELWIKMGNQLEIDGIPKEQISTIMRKDIENMLYEKQFKEFMSREKYHWHNNTYWLVTKEYGWINSSMARHIDPTRIKEIVPYTNPKMKTVCYDLINLSRILIDKSKDGIPFEETYGIFLLT